MMQLEHCNIMTFDLAATVAFYTDVLALKDGPAPVAREMGAWLYDSTGTPVLHIVAVDRDDPERSLALMRARDEALGGRVQLSTLSGGGAIDHIAFACDDYEAMEARLKARGLKFAKNDVVQMNLRQLFVNDPNGVTIELNFR